MMVGMHVFLSHCRNSIILSSRSGPDQGNDKMGRRPGSRYLVGFLKAAESAAIIDPTPGTSTPRRCCRRAYVVGGLTMISGVVLILTDVISPIRLF